MRHLLAGRATADDVTRADQYDRGRRRHSDPDGRHQRKEPSSMRRVQLGTLLLLVVILGLARRGHSRARRRRAVDRSARAGARSGRSGLAYQQVLVHLLRDGQVGRPSQRDRLAAQPLRGCDSGLLNRSLGVKPENESTPELLKCLAVGSGPARAARPARGSGRWRPGSPCGPRSWARPYCRC